MESHQPLSITVPYYHKQHLVSTIIFIIIFDNFNTYLSVVLIFCLQADYFPFIADIWTSPIVTIGPWRARSLAQSNGTEVRCDPFGKLECSGNRYNLF